MLLNHDSNKIKLIDFGLSRQLKDGEVVKEMLGTPEFVGRYMKDQCNKGVLRTDSTLAPSQWETSLQSNGVSHWLGTNLESALCTVFVHEKWYTIDKVIKSKNEIQPSILLYFSPRSNQLWPIIHCNWHVEYRSHHLYTVSRGLTQLLQHF